VGDEAAVTDRPRAEFNVAAPNIKYWYTVLACSNLSCSASNIPTGITNIGLRAPDRPNPAKEVMAGNGTELDQVEVSWSSWYPKSH